MMPVTDMVGDWRRLDVWTAKKLMIGSMDESFRGNWIRGRGSCWSSDVGDQLDCCWRRICKWGFVGYLRFTNFLGVIASASDPMT